MIHHRRARQSGISLLLGILSLMFIIPMVGLTIDVCILYTVRARLQSSVDGAALAAARSLNLGQTTDAQATSAKQNAVNWFYANFPTGTWATTSTTMSASNVSVYDDTSNAHLRNVTVTASTLAPTYFMHWLGFGSVNVSATGNASRRDVVVMMVLDKSGSMGSVCSTMKSAAKIFTGQFATGRDMVGLVTFNDSAQLVSSPTTNFQSVLGYTNGSGSGTGAIDSITCAGGTGTAQAISLAWNELYRVGLPGALNVIMFETDGLPNTLTLSLWDSTNNVAGIASTSACKDANNKKVSSGGFTTLASLPNWTTAPSLGSGSYYTLPSGITGGFYSSDPSQGSYFDIVNYYWGTNNNYLTSSTVNSCGFLSSHSSTADFAWFPSTDVWGNELYPSSHPYKAVTMSGGHVSNSGWTNFHNAALNAADDAAHNARTNSTIPAYFFGIALGGNGGDPPDLTLMQRMANDPNGDNFSGSNAYTACSQNPNCVYYSSEPQGTLVYSTNSATLSRAFLSISSQILRLSK